MPMEQEAREWNYSFTISEQGYIVTVLMAELCCDADFCKTAQRVKQT